MTTHPASRSPPTEWPTREASTVKLRLHQSQQVTETHQLIERLQTNACYRATWVPLRKDVNNGPFQTSVRKIDMRSCPSTHRQLTDTVVRLGYKHQKHFDTKYLATIWTIRSGILRRVTKCMIKCENMKTRDTLSLWTHQYAHICYLHVSINTSRTNPSHGS